MIGKFNTNQAQTFMFLFLKGFKHEHHKAEDGLSKKHWDHADKKGHHSDYDNFDSFFKKHAGGGFSGKSHKVNCLAMLSDILQTIMSV